MAENINVADENIVSPVSSGANLLPAAEAETVSRVRATLESEKAAKTAFSGAAKLLNEPHLPGLQRRDRARLQMQSPSRLYFYWSVAADPFQRLRQAFGGETGSYLLVAKLINNADGSEEIHPVESEGNWWFRVRPDATYRAEIGFYAPNRPYFRILYSNSVAVPRSGPSKRAAGEADWMVTAEKFAEVLDLSGYAEDAAAVAAAETVAEPAPGLRRVASGLFEDDHRVDEFTDDELYRALLAVASGVPIEALRWVISAKLFAFLQDNVETIFSSTVRLALREHFELDESEYETDASEGAVYGASRVNFPSRRSRRLRRGPFGLRPVGSHSIPVEVSA